MQDSDEFDVVDLILLLELHFQDTDCAISNALEWATHATTTCSPSQALRIKLFLTSLQSRMPDQQHKHNSEVHKCSIDIREDCVKSKLGKRRHESTNNDELQALYDVAKESLSGKELEDLLNSVANM